MLFRSGKIRRRLTQALLSLAQFADVAFRRFDIVGDLGRDAGAFAAIDLGLFTSWKVCVTQPIFFAIETTVADRD